MVCSILDLKLKDKVKVQTIRNKTNTSDIGWTVKKLKLGYAGYLARSHWTKWNKKTEAWYQRDLKRGEGDPPKKDGRMKVQICIKIKVNDFSSMPNFMKWKTFIFPAPTSLIEPILVISRFFYCKPAKHKSKLTHIEKYKTILTQ